MPTYELRCPDCGCEFDRFLMRLLRQSDKVCPECGSMRVLVGVGGGFLTRRSESESTCVPRGGFS
ncbi:MAG: zinc ribbon domain-containing protein [Coriobacteriia bacterium]|nr:zinc ribbon domain-containing protein [Coriobacteriia bacterium]